MRRGRGGAGARAVLGTLAAMVLLGTVLHPARLTTPGPGDPRPAHRGRAVPAFDAAFQDGVRLLRAGEHARALGRFEAVLREAPALPEARVNAGFALVGLHRYRMARDLFLSTIELRPMQANAYWGLAVSLEALGDLEGARGAMRAFVHLAPPGLEHVRRARAALWEWGDAGVRSAAGSRP